MRRRTFHINIAEVAVRCQAVFGSVIQKALVHLWEVLVSATVIDADCRCLREFTDARTDAVRCDRNDVQTVRIGVRRYLNANDIGAWYQYKPDEVLRFSVPNLHRGIHGKIL